MNTLTTTVVPTWVAVALGAATVALLCGVVLLMLRSKKAAVAQTSTASHEKALRRLFLAALIPTLIVIAAVMGISFIGLSSFARHDMGWQSWISLIVPLSLDGISITFGFWAFVAVKRGRHPGRSEKIVYVGALISAWINYNHGSQEWTGAAGIYLGFLSIAAAWMFHELLSQFMDAQEALPKARRNGTPMFGERWMWAPWSTLMARRAWVVYPPSPDVEPTAVNALAHLEQAREARRTKRMRQVPSRTTVPEAASKAEAVATEQTTRTPAVANPSTPVLAVPTIANPAPATVSPASASSAAASAKDSPVAMADAARHRTPMPASLLTRARHLANAHQGTEGTPITAGELAVRMRVDSELAAQLLAAFNLDQNRVTEPATPVNGMPVGALR